MFCIKLHYSHICFVTFLYYKKIRKRKTFKAFKAQKIYQFAPERTYTRKSIICFQIYKLFRYVKYALINSMIIDKKLIN